MTPRHPATVSSWVLVLTFAGLSAGIVAAGYAQYRHHRAHLRREMQAELTGVAGFKAQQLAAWRRERAASLARISANRLTSVGAAAFLADPDGVLNRDSLRPWLEALKEHEQLHAAYLIDARGEVRLAAPAGAHPMNARGRAAALEAMRQGRVVITDLERAEPRGFIHLDLVAPLGPAAAGAAPGAVVACVNPAASLFPLVQTWPTPSPSAETLLVRRDGDEVVFLNELRHRKGTALRLHHSAATAGLPAALAVRGHAGPLEGRDYRGVPVLAAVQGVPRSAWFVVAKVDSQEVYAPLRSHAVFLLVLVLALVGAAGASVGLAWRHQQARFVRRELADLAERRAAEAALRESEESLAATLRSIGDAVVATDADGRVTRMNPVAEGLTGWPLPEARGRPLPEILPLIDERTRAREEDPAARVLREGKPVGLANHTALVARDGRERPIADSGAPILDAGGLVRGAVIVFRDVTEHRARDEALAAQAEMLASMSDAVIGIDTDQRVRTWNPAAESIYGWSAAEALGRPAAELLGLEPADPGVATLFHALTTTGRYSGPLPAHRADGSPLAIEVTITTLYDDDGHATGHVGVHRDVGARAQTELALRASEERYRALVDQAPVGIFQVDRHGDLVVANDRFYQLTGLTTDQAIGRGWQRAIDPDDRERALAEALAALARRGRAEVHHRLRTPGGEVRWVLSTAVSLRDDGGASVGQLGFVIDLTEHHKLQARLVQADRMVSVGTLAAGVAHEINNPLAYVVANLGYAVDELARAPAGAVPVSDVLEALREAQEGADRVRRIVRDLKTFSRADEERVAPVNVEAVLESAISMAFNEIRHRAQLVREFAGVPPLHANDARLGQVFLNLLVNAAQAIPEGQADHNQIRVRTRQDAAGAVVVEIEDTGAGIPAEARARIFDPFFTTKPVGEGTGLGLAICHSIVTALGGELQVESTVGQGSLFRVVLPVTAAPAQAAAPAAAAAAPVRRGRVLVIDDEAMVARAVKRTLAERHEVEVETEPAKALARLADGERFDVILCDLMMPEVTGMDLYDELERRSPELLLRLVFLTGGAFTARAREFLERVPNVRLDKPVDRALLERTVAELLG